MSREIQRILNVRIKLSTVVDESSFATVFANGYHIGEILSKFGLQPDFSLFNNKSDEETSIRNFSRIIPALDDAGMELSLHQVREIMQAFPGAAVRTVYRLLKALHVLPMKDPSWTISKAKTFRRKGSWADFEALKNVDYETFRMLDQKYAIPGEEKCRDLEERLRNFLVPRDRDFTLVPLRSDAHERNKYATEWESTVQRELDRFDNERDEPSSTAAHVRTTENESTLISGGSSQEVKLDLQNDLTQRISTPDKRTPGAEVTADVLFSQLPDTSDGIFTQGSTTFDKAKYLENIHRKAVEYREKKAELARERQIKWMDYITLKKRERERELLLSRLNQINLRAEKCRKNGRERLQRHRNSYDKLLFNLAERKKAGILRQFEYVKAMVNNGFWDLRGHDILSEESLKSFCKDAELEYDPNIHQVLSRNYETSRRTLLKHYDLKFFIEFDKVAAEEGDEYAGRIVEEDPADVNISPASPADLSEDRTGLTGTTFGLDDETDDLGFRSSDPPIITWNDRDLDEYNEIIRSVQLEELGWANEFLRSACEKRNLGHIVACVLNGETRKPLASKPVKYPPKYVSICVLGQRNSLLKKAVLTKLASTYNLEIISATDLVQEVIESALQLQPDVVDLKEKLNSRRKSKTMTATKRGSVVKISRGKTRSLASPVSSLASAGRFSPKSEVNARALRSLIEQGNVDSGILCELIDLAIDTRVVNIRMKSPDIPHGAATLLPVPSTATVKKAAHDGKPKKLDSKTELHEKDHGTLQLNIEPSAPFGWIVTDVPCTTEFMEAVEQRLGTFSTDTSHSELGPLMSMLVPDEFGPKPKELHRSFFNCVINLNCPDGEASLLGQLDEILPQTSPPTPDQLLEERASPQETQVRRKLKLNSPQALGDMDLNELSSALSPSDMKRQFGRFLKNYDNGDASVSWQNVRELYKKFTSSQLVRVKSWRTPEKAFTELCKLIQQAFDECSKVCSFGVSPAEESCQREISNQICDFVWRYRSILRQCIAQSMVGLGAAKTIIQHLFDQDVCLVRDLYLKCSSELGELIRKSGDSRPKTFGLAMYRQTNFPLKSRKLIYRKLALPHDLEPRDQATNSYRRSSGIQSEKTTDVNAQFQDFLFASFSVDLGAEVTDDSLPKNVLSWYRQNELRIEIFQLEPEHRKTAVFEFPFIERESSLHLVEEWAEVEQAAADFACAVIPKLKVIESHLVRNTATLKEMFNQTLTYTNSIIEDGIACFCNDLGRLRMCYPEIHPIKDWIKKRNSLHSQLCTVVDTRHMSMRVFLRNLMRNNGYSDIIFDLRNTFMVMVQAEINMLRRILRFLWTVLCHVMGIQDVGFLALPKVSLPSYKLGGNSAPTITADDPVPRHDTEHRLRNYIASESLPSDQESFLRIEEGDDEFWKNCLEISRYTINQCKKSFFKQLKKFKIPVKDMDSVFQVYPSTPRDHPTSLVKEDVEYGNSFVEKYPDPTHSRSASLTATNCTRLTARRTAESLQKWCRRKGKNWLSIFEVSDFESLLSTVSADSRQEEKNINWSSQVDDQSKTGAETNEKPQNARRASKRSGMHSSVAVKMICQTVPQESSECVAKILRIATECKRRCIRVRSTAVETFCILDQCLHETHRKEQTYIDEFAKTSLVGLESDPRILAAGDF